MLTAFRHPRRCWPRWGQAGAHLLGHLLGRLLTRPLAGLWLALTLTPLAHAAATQTVLHVAVAANFALPAQKIAAESGFGIACTALALLGITAGTLYEKRFGVSHHPVTSNMIQYAVGAAFCLPFAWMTEDMHVTWNAEFAFALAYLVLANSILAMSLLLAMIRAGEVSRVSALFYLVPAFSALFAWPMLGEAMPPLAWAGMALAGLGVAMVSRKRG